MIEFKSRIYGIMDHDIRPQNYRLRNHFYEFRYDYGVMNIVDNLKEMIRGMGWKYVVYT